LGAEPSAACGRYSEAQHGQNNEKPNRVQVSTMFCPWRREKAAQKREAQKEGIGWASINLPFLKFFGPAPFLFEEKVRALFTSSSHPWYTYKS
jgi:hypothetical protein